MKGYKVLLANILSAVTAVIIVSTPLLLQAEKALARIPEPDTIFYGTVTVDGELVTAESQGIIALKIDPNSDPIASYTMGANQAAGDFYVLRVPIYAQAEEEPHLAKPGDEAQIYINSLVAGTVTIGDMGSIQLINLNISPGDEDSDGDGLLDSLEQSLGTDSNNPDTDGDGLSDGDEVNIYTIDPLNGDTDEDGLPDGWEVSYSLDPLIDDALADDDNDGFTNLEEYQTGLNPLDEGSRPFTILQPDGHEVSELEEGLNFICFHLESPTLHYTSFDLLQHFAVHGDLISIHCEPSLSPDVFSTSIASYWFYGNPSGVNFDIVSDQIYLVNMKSGL